MEKVILENNSGVKVQLLLLSVSLGCPIWDDVGTYLTSSENNKEITALIVAINHFKEKKNLVI